MPRLPDDDAEASTSLTGHVRNHVSSFWEGFCNFALRDNVLEVAIGLIFASAFTAVANSLVTDIILPVVSLLPFISRNLDEAFVVLKAGKAGSRASSTYNTVKQGLDDGAVIWAYGAFLDKLLRFLLIAVSLYAIARIYEVVSKDKVVKAQARCRYCRKYISAKAKRCVNCTSWTDGREDK